MNPSSVPPPRYGENQPAPAPPPWQPGGAGPQQYPPGPPRPPKKSGTGLVIALVVLVGLVGLVGLAAIGAAVRGAEDESSSVTLPEDLRERIDEASEQLDEGITDLVVTTDVERADAIGAAESFAATVETSLGVSAGEGRCAGEALVRRIGASRVLELADDGFASSVPPDEAEAIADSLVDCLDIREWFAGNVNQGAPGSSEFPTFYTDCIFEGVGGDAALREQFVLIFSGDEATAETAEDFGADAAAECVDTFTIEQLDELDQILNG